MKANSTRPRVQQDAAAAIHAELTGDNHAEALGRVVKSPSPLLVLCRKLLEAGHDPRQPLHACRGATVSLIVTSIGAAADLEIGGNGIGFVRRCKRRRIGPPMRGGGPADIRQPGKRRPAP